MTNHTDTPRTDAAMFKAGHTSNYTDCVTADFARTLERTISEREGQLRECVELLEAIVKSGDINVLDFVDSQEEMGALLARLKETL